MLNRQKIGVKIRGKPKSILMLRFTDDIVIITNNENEMEMGLEEMQKCIEEFRYTY